MRVLVLCHNSAATSVLTRLVNVELFNDLPTFKSNVSDDAIVILTEALNNSETNGLMVAAELRVDFPDLPIILLVDQSCDAFFEAMRLNVLYVLELPLSYHGVSRIIHHIRNDKHIVAEVTPTRQVSDCTTFKVNDVGDAATKILLKLIVFIVTLLALLYGLYEIKSDAHIDFVPDKHAEDIIREYISR